MQKESNAANTEQKRGKKARKILLLIFAVLLFLCLAGYLYIIKKL